MIAIRTPTTKIAIAHRTPVASAVHDQRRAS